MSFTEHVHMELSRARRQHPAPMHSLHEGFAVLLEEVHEVWEEVRRKERDRSLILAELIQVGAMAQRIAEDLSLVR